MAINKKLIFWKSATFNPPTSSTDTTKDVLWSSIVFFGSTAGTYANSIWTHGQVFSAGTWGINQTNYVPLTLSGTTYNLSKDGHTHNYLPLTGGIMTSNILFNTTATGIDWSMNSDMASIKFYNTGDGDTDSRLQFTIGDNSNEYFSWRTSAGTELLKLLPSDTTNGLTFRGKNVWHADNSNSASVNWAANTLTANTVTSTRITGVKLANGDIRNNLGDPTVEEMALFHGQFNNKLRFISPTSQEESTDGVTWIASSRATSDQLADMMIGEGQGTGFNAIPTGTIGTYGGYRLTWDVYGQIGYVCFNYLYVYNSTSGNTVTFKIEAYHNTNGWENYASGSISNWPGHTVLKHNAIWYSNSASQYGKIRVTFSTTHNAYTNPFVIYGIEWFGGYPAARRNVESYDRNKNVTFPAAVYGTTFYGNLNGNATTATTWQTPRTLTIGASGKSVNGAGDVSWSLAEIGAAESVHTHNYLPLIGGNLTGAITISNQAAINTTTPGTQLYGLHFLGQSTSDYATGITWNGGNTGAQAGIYVQGSGSYGTKMYIATTDAYVSGSKTAISIDHTGLVNFERVRPKALGNLILDVGNYSSYALPLGGGTLTGQLEISNDAPQMKFSDTTSGAHDFWIHVNSDTFYILTDRNNDGNWDGNHPAAFVNSDASLYIYGDKALDTGNYSTYALPINGGTMTGSLNFKNGTWNNVGDNVAIGDVNVAGQLGIKTLNSTIPGIAFYNNSGVAIGNLTSNAGTLQWNGSTVWHAGNDGSGSGLDADLLDGVHLDRVIYGSNATGSTSISENDLNTGLKSGYYTVTKTDNTKLPSGASSVNFLNHTAYIGVGNLAGMDLLTTDNVNSNLYFRSATGAGKGIWRTVLDSENYNSYSPSKTGTGASGTWGINISGTAAKLYAGGSTSGTQMIFNWSGQGGQPTWLWGGTDGTNMYVYNPSNFSVNYATSAGTATSATYASAVTLTADNSTNATNYPLFVNAATGNLSPRTDTGFTYNPSTGTLTATTFSGALSGNASSADLLVSTGGLTTQHGDRKIGYSGPIEAATTGIYPTVNNANSILTINRHPGNYYSQLGFSSNGNMYYRSFSGVAIDTTTAWNVIWTNGNHGSGSGLNADLLDGYHAYEFSRPYYSNSDFANGTLVQTNIPSNTTDGASFILEATGKSYSDTHPPFSFIIQGYLYNNTIVSYSGSHLTGYGFNTAKILDNGGFLAFWWPRVSYWNSFQVIVRDATYTGTVNNRVTAITDVVEPTSSKKVTVTMIKNLSSANYTEYTIPKTGGTITGNLTAMAFYESSDINLKTNIQTLNDNVVNLVFSEDFIKSFDWKSDSTPDYGVIAQHIEKYFPNLITTNTSGSKHVKYNAVLSLIAGAAVKKIKSLEERITNLENK